MKAKLIRDKLGGHAGSVVRPVNSMPGKQLALVSKLHEEAEEIAECATDPAEYADMIEVLIELARINGVSWEEIERTAIEKREERGGFRRGLIMYVE